ncbi:hypothetical protein O9993_17525 [Vibrio lentus]|nr:hypothetical protein [Vibrio lentus]
MTILAVTKRPASRCKHGFIFCERQPSDTVKRADTVKAISSNAGVKKEGRRNEICAAKNSRYTMRVIAVSESFSKGDGEERIDFYATSLLDSAPAAGERTDERAADLISTVSLHVLSSQRK